MRMWAASPTSKNERVFSSNKFSNLYKMKYGLFRSNENEAPTSISFNFIDSNGPSLSKQRNLFSFNEPSIPEQNTSSTFFDRKRRAMTIVDDDNTAAVAYTKPKRTPKPHNSLRFRRYLGTPLPPPMSAPITSSSTSTSSSHLAFFSAYAKGDRYRELAERAKLKVRRVSTDGLEHARSNASQSYAKQIQRELEETQSFLSKLSIDGSSKPTATLAAGMAKVDTDVAETLKCISDLRKEYEQKCKDETEAQSKKRKEKEQKEKEARESSLPKQPTEKSKPPAPAFKPKVAEPAKKAEPAKAEKKQEAVASTPSKQQVSAGAIEWASKYRGLYRDLMDKLAPMIKNDKEIKSYCFKQRGVITRNVGQLKDSWTFINRCVGNISNVLAESTQRGADVHNWMLNLTAKAIVKQSEKEVAVAQHAAYPLATAAVQLMQVCPPLADMLMIRLVKKCPYVVPQYFGKKPSQTNEEYMHSLGYKEHDEGELESEGIYMERMVGMIALMAAIVQVGDGKDETNAIPVRFGWVWLSRMLNLAPRSISPLLVHTFLSIAGTAMMQTYGKQLKKLLQLLMQQWIPAITSKEPSAVAAKSNLEGYMEEYMKTGILKECEGRQIKP